MSLDLLLALARANLAIAAAVLIVAILRKPARRAFGARAAYLLWIVPALAGIAVLVPPASVDAPLAAPIAVDAVVAVAGGAVEATVDRAPQAPLVLAGLWLAGGVAAAALLLLRQARFVSALGRLTPMAPRLYRAERPGTGPAVVGALFPRIVTPADFEARFAPPEREVVLAHERAHLARGDAAANALAAGVLCVCWFNPLVHLGVWLMRQDQELACDAAVLGCFPEKRRLYAEVLLKTQLSNQALPFGCCWPPASEHPLKERIVMLKSPLPAPGRRAIGVGAVLLLSAATAAAAWAAQPGRPAPAAPAAASPLPPLDDRRCTAEEKALYDCKDDGAGPVWLEKPTAAQIRAEYPADALKARASGRAFLSCFIDGYNGRLRECIAVREVAPGIRRPPGYDFERPALRLAKYYRVDLKTVVRDAKGRMPMMRIAVDFVSAPDAPSAASAVADANAAEPATRASPTSPASPASPAAPGSRPSPASPPAPVTTTSVPLWPDWIERPDGADVARFYPAAASAAKQEGRATLECGVDGEGRLTNCKVANEAPAATGFGEAALQLAAEFRMKAKDRNGVNTNGGMVRIPFRFTTPGS